jgi:hypothetical protein
MMQNILLKTFGTAVFHTYFENNECNCLYFTPTKESEFIINKFGFKLKNNSNGFDLYYNPISTLSAILDYIEKTTMTDYFEFIIKTKDPDISLYTEMPVDGLGQVNFSSQNSNNQNSTGHFILNPIFETSTYNTGFGLLKIYFQDIQNAQNTCNSIQYDINFSSRATQWQYYIINRNAIPIENPSISEKGQIQFDGPQSITIQTGEQALLFTSKNLLPVSEKPKYIFDLINTTHSIELPTTRSKIILKSLPVPDASRITIIALNNQNQVASPMYIYL